MPSIYMRTSSAIIDPISDVFRAMTRDAKIRYDQELVADGYFILHMPADDWHAFALVLMALHGATDAQMADVFLDILILVQLATLADKYNIADGLAAWGDFWIDRAREQDDNILSQLGTYIWVAQVFRANHSFMELTAMAQSQCTGLRVFTMDEDEGSVTPLPKWVMRTSCAYRIVVLH